MARKIKGNERRIARSIRIEPSKRELIEKKYGTIQKWFDLVLSSELEKMTLDKNSAKVVTLESKTQKTKKVAANKIKKLIDELF